MISSRLGCSDSRPGCMKSALPELPATLFLRINKCSWQKNLCSIVAFPTNVNMKQQRNIKLQGRFEWKLQLFQSWSNSWFSPSSLKFGNQQLIFRSKQRSITKDQRSTIKEQPSHRSPSDSGTCRARWATRTACPWTRSRGRLRFCLILFNDKYFCHFVT